MLTLNYTVLSCLATALGASWLGLLLMNRARIRCWRDQCATQADVIQGWSTRLAAANEAKDEAEVGRIEADEEADMAKHFRDVAEDKVRDAENKAWQLDKERCDAQKKVARLGQRCLELEADRAEQLSKLNTALGDLIDTRRQLIDRDWPDADRTTSGQH